MQPEQLILPAVATMALGTALLVPLRDDRLGRRATLGGIGDPLRSIFPQIADGDRESASATRDATADSEAVEPDPSAAFVAVDPQATDGAPSSDDDVLPPSSEQAPPGALATIGARVRAWFTAPAKPLHQLPGSTPTETTASDASDLPGDAPAVIERSFADLLGALVPTEADRTQSPVSEVAPVAPVTTVALPEPAVPVVHVVASAHTSNDRIVPLTRMPLRPQAQAITWPALTDSRALETPAERHAFLIEAARSPDSSLEAALFAAYREEDPRGRVLALRAIGAARFPGGPDAFRDALHVGTDEERSFAIDALAALGARDGLRPAFDDRVDAIAAQAALAYVGTHDRTDYLRELAPFVDGSRIEAILALLAGVVE